MKKTIIFFLLFIEICNAGSISLQSTLPNNVDIKNSSTINGLIINNGNEPAYNLKISMIGPDQFSSTTDTKQALASHKQWNFTLNITRNQDTKPGLYPGILSILYEDKNSYLFSNLVNTKLIYKQKTISDIILNIQNSKISQYGQIKAKIKNTGKQPHNIIIKPYVPREFSARKEKIVLLKPDEEKSIGLDLRNKNALQGSSYAFYLMGEYENGKHFSTIGKSLILVEKEKTRPLIYILIFLIILVAVYHIKKER